MARVRCITEMGMGVDVHGRDATKAAKRAVSDAIRHSSLGFFRMLGKTANDMRGPDRVEQGVDRIGLPYVGDMRGCLEVAAGQLGHERIELATVAPNHGDMASTSM